MVFLPSSKSELCIRKLCGIWFYKPRQTVLFYYFKHFKWQMCTQERT